jgi:8-oxo-dGTP pyrophosphatase MutT (NUDIX family)
MNLRTAFTVPPNPLELPKGFRDAAVLVPIWQEQLLLTVRSANLNSHAAQISFPGGRVDHGESYEECALREAWEEVGLPTNTVEVVGQLSPLLSPFGFRVFPIVGLVNQEPQLDLNAHEVDKVLWVPISELQITPAYTEVRKLNRLPENAPVAVREVFTDPNSPFKARLWHYPWKGYDIWGLTGNIVQELLEKLKAEG